MGDGNGHPGGFRGSMNLEQRCCRAGRPLPTEWYDDDAVVGEGPKSPFIFPRRRLEMITPDHIDVESLRLSASAFGQHVRSSIPSVPRHRSNEKFLKGPIPMDWLSAAAMLPGKTFQVAVAVWYLVGICGKNAVKITGATSKLFGVERKALYQAIKKLEDAGLIAVVDRRRGVCPVVSLLEAPTSKQRSAVKLDPRPTLGSGNETAKRTD